MSSNTFSASAMGAPASSSSGAADGAASARSSTAAAAQVVAPTGGGSAAAATGGAGATDLPSIRSQLSDISARVAAEAMEPASASASEQLALVLVVNALGTRKAFDWLLQSFQRAETPMSFDPEPATSSWVVKVGDSTARIPLPDSALRTTEPITDAILQLATVWDDRAAILADYETWLTGALIDIDVEAAGAASASAAGMARAQGAVQRYIDISTADESIAGRAHRPGPRPVLLPDVARRAHRVDVRRAPHLGP